MGLLLISLIGCASQQKHMEPPVDAPDKFSAAGSLEVTNRWWTSFDDRQLNALVDTAMASNFNLKTAWQRLKEANAVVDRESADLFPDLEGSIRAVGNQTQNNTLDPGSVQLGLSSVYELDLWGRIRSEVQAEKLRAQATLADYQTAALSLSAEITRTWYRLSEARNEKDLVRKQIKTNKKVLNLLENRFGTGQIRSVDILRQRQLLESTREQLTNVEMRIRLLEHQLSVLLGRPPQRELDHYADELPTLPPPPVTGVPIELVRRRPDVQSAFNSLRAADRDLAAAISSQYPRLTLSASVSSAPDNAQNLFENWAMSFAGNLVAPILYGGQLSAEVDRNRALKKQRLYEYGQTILTAFREVENALVQEKMQRERIRSLEKQVKLAEQAYDQLQLEYFNGMADYLDVLTALDEVQQLQRDLLSARLTLVEYRIALHRSLAGSFETDREISSRQSDE